MARKQTIREAEETPTMDTDSFEDTNLYMDAEGKGARLGTLEADDKSKENSRAPRSRTPRSSKTMPRESSSVNDGLHRGQGEPDPGSRA